MKPLIFNPDHYRLATRIDENPAIKLFQSIAFEQAFEANLWQLDKRLNTGE